MVCESRYTVSSFTTARFYITCKHNLQSRGPSLLSQPLPYHTKFHWLDTLACGLQTFNPDLQRWDVEGSYMLVQPYLISSNQMGPCSFFPLTRPQLLNSKRFLLCFRRTTIFFQAKRVSMKEAILVHSITNWWQTTRLLPLPTFPNNLNETLSACESTAKKLLATLLNTTKAYSFCKLYIHVGIQFETSL